jgi:hypothetical protein
VLAVRLARGLGYTWAWPDGAVTYAAHYPVGYPALLAAVYFVFGERVGAAMLLNACFGAATVYVVHRLAATRASRAGSNLAAALVALHPALVFYTPALMTEGLAGTLIALSALVSIAPRPSADGAPRRSPSFALTWTGAIAGVATLVRPQSLLVAPFFGALGVSRATAKRRLVAACAVTAVALAVCAPWTIRNCRRMEACALVSANAGWNLLIGAAEGATGSWVSLDAIGVPRECSTVWAEAAKDACFERAAVGAIRRDPLRWLGLVPRKLAVTFDYAGAAGWYLHSSNAAAFDDRDKIALGVIETIWQRVVVLLGLAAVSLAPGPRVLARRGALVAGAASLFTRSAWVGHVALVVDVLLLGKRAVDFRVAAIAASALLVTIVTHAVFFGAGRYSLVCFPVLSALAGAVLTGAREPGNTGVSG